MPLPLLPPKLLMVRPWTVLLPALNVRPLAAAHGNRSRELRRVVSGSVRRRGGEHLALEIAGGREAEADKARRRIRVARTAVGYRHRAQECLSFAVARRIGCRIREEFDAERA